MCAAVAVTSTNALCVYGVQVLFLALPHLTGRPGDNCYTNNKTRRASKKRIKQRRKNNALRQW